MRAFVAAFAIIAGIALIAMRKKFAQRAVNQRNVFGRSNASSGEPAARLGPVVVGCFMLICGVLVATGVADPA